MKSLAGSDQTSLSALMYKTRFQNAAAVRHYDESVYAPHSHDAYMQILEERVLRRLAQRMKPPEGIRYMDFACGTGRILSVLAAHTKLAVGIDVSEAMLERARRRVPGITVRVQDLISDPIVVEGPFDLITAFRFFLNLEPASRGDYLRALADNLRSHESLLVFNIHGNRHSVRHLAGYRRKADSDEMNEMSRREIEGVLNGAGLEVVRRWGIGLLPRSLYERGIAPVAGALDRLLFASGLFDNVSQNLIYACRRRFV